MLDEDIAMGLEQTVTFPGNVPAWTDVSALLKQRGFPLQMRMIDGELACPDETPPEPWRELRVGTEAGMVTLRRGPDRVTLVTWGNADLSLLKMRNALAWAFACVGAGHIVIDDHHDEPADDFLRHADFPSGFQP
jgi:hypothetical protein